jgi:hypothetical protein
MKHNMMNNAAQLAVSEVTTLEYEMTNCAYGYAHALCALEEEEGLGWRAEEINQELDSFKQSYFSARERLLSINAQRLVAFESDLQMQKNLVFVRHESLQ